MSISESLESFVNGAGELAGVIAERFFPGQSPDEAVANIDKAAMSMGLEEYNASTLNSVEVGTPAEATASVVGRIATESGPSAANNLKNTVINSVPGAQIDIEEYRRRVAMAYDVSVDKVASTIASNYNSVDAKIKNILTSDSSRALLTKSTDIKHAEYIKGLQQLVSDAYNEVAHND